jgi:hypothetical protein
MPAASKNASLLQRGLGLVVEVPVDLERAEADTERDPKFSADARQPGERVGLSLRIVLAPALAQPFVVLGRVDVEAVAGVLEELRLVLALRPGPLLAVEALDQAKLGLHPFSPSWPGVSPGHPRTPTFAMAAPGAATRQTEIMDAR